MKDNDCPECGRPLAATHAEWINDLCAEEKLCGARTDHSIPAALENCAEHTIARLKARVTELERQVDKKLRVWELSDGTTWCVAENSDECWAYLDDHRGNPDAITEMQEEGVGWVALPDDKKLSIYVDSDGDICSIDDGGPLMLPCWVWAVRRGAGFLGEEQ